MFFLQKTQPQKPQKVIQMLNKQLYTEGRLIISAHKKMNEKSFESMTMTVMSLI